MASGDPFAWLGLLKWSLSYSDGTTTTGEATPMGAEDREFLERVMREGIIDENERMKSILKQVTVIMDGWKDGSASTLTGAGTMDENNRATEEREASELLDELRDIVEHIDYARAFCALRGLPFLLGCAQERQYIPRSTRIQCLGVLATVAQNNPPVQKELLDAGALKTLSDLYFCEDQNPTEDVDGALRARILQAISAMVRGYDVAEQVFGELEQATSIVEAGLGFVGGTSPSPVAVPVDVRKRALFFLRALVTSDSSNRRLVERFAVPISAVANYVAIRRDADDTSVELLEMGLSLLVQILEQKHSVDAVLQLKEALASAGVERISVLRQLQGEQREDASHELELWEQLLRLLATATPDANTMPQ
jgi:hsp70-interacting protein